MNYPGLRITDKNLSQWQSSLKEFEKSFSYPLGDDSFIISHGENYLAFFERMGKAAVYACRNGDQIISVGAGVIHKRYGCWYLCDMKVHPDFRGMKLTQKMFRRNFFFNYLKSQRGFAITMESSDGKKNPIMKIMESLPWTPLKQGPRLVFFYEDAEKTSEALKVLKVIRPDAHFSSLAGIKDLVMKSTGKPLPVLHLEWGVQRKNEAIISLPQKDNLHMWCLPENHELVSVLSQKGIHVKASALIFHHRAGFIDWSQLRTSEI